LDRWSDGTVVGVAAGMLDRRCCTGPLFRTFLHLAAASKVAKATVLRTFLHLAAASKVAKTAVFERLCEILETA